MRSTLFTMMFLLMGIYLRAQQVSSGEARREAEAFAMARHTRTRAQAHESVSLAFKSDDDGRPTSYYVFNVDGGRGFVIISGDKRTPKILGYADSGQIDRRDMPAPMALLLKSYQQDIQAMRRAPSPRRAVPALASTAARHAVEPIVKSKWNQLWPYYLQCPMADGKPTPTGCVATAMAQVMFAQRCPSTRTTRPIPSDRYEAHATGKDFMPRHAFEWDKMLNDYKKGSSDEQNQAVAYLMRQCGAAVMMDYSPYGSTAPDNLIVPALVNYFGYDADATLVIRDFYPTEEWTDMIYNEVAAGRPVIYVASSPTDGTHAFVCDGYRQGDYFHVNWGWGGSRDGYFRLSVLNAYAPDGIGNTEGYTIFHSAAIGLQPEDHVVTRPLVQVTELAFKLRLVKRDDPAQDFKPLRCSFSYKNIMAVPIRVEVGLGLFVGGKLERALIERAQTLEPGEETKMEGVTLGSIGVRHDGAAIAPICRTQGDDKWMKCTNTDAFSYVLSVGERKMFVRRGDIPQPKPRLRVDNVTLIGDMTAGEYQFIRATITNVGGSFSGQLFLYVDGEKAGYMGAYIAAAATDSVAFTFMSQRQGRHVFSIENAEGAKLYEGHMDIVPTGVVPIPSTESHSSGAFRHPDRWFDLLGRQTPRPRTRGVYILGRKKIAF